MSFMIASRKFSGCIGAGASPVALAYGSLFAEFSGSCFAFLNITGLLVMVTKVSYFCHRARNYRVARWRHDRGHRPRCHPDRSFISSRFSHQGTSPRRSPPIMRGLERAHSRTWRLHIAYLRASAGVASSHWSVYIALQKGGPGVQVCTSLTLMLAWLSPCGSP